MDLAKYKGCLGHLAAKPDNATREDQAGLTDEDRCYMGVLNPYQLDLVKLLGSKALARSEDKTQVFISRENPYTRPRSRHTRDVKQVALAIASVTNLHCDLTMAGALGHDIGHLPFGHHGEIAFTNISGKKICHATVGVIVARRIERRGVGLNLTNDTLQIILNHSLGAGDFVSFDGLPEETAVVMWADKIAYVFGDVNDFARCLTESEPDLVCEICRRANEFGQNQRARVAMCVEALVEESEAKGRISFLQSECARKFDDFRKWLYEEAYFPAQGARSVVIDGLQRGYDLLATCEEFRDCDHLLLLALLTDKEARRLMDWLSIAVGFPSSRSQTSGLSRSIDTSRVSKSISPILGARPIAFADHFRAPLWGALFNFKSRDKI
ncbi:MAG: HD domain-containing protein [Candidatus Berkelbacteria bacterium]|nr:HD domain-containing protein [Candidatus Berkelbacteria bacterium]